MKTMLVYRLDSVMVVYEFTKAEEEEAYYENIMREEDFCGSMDLETCKQAFGGCKVDQPHIITRIPDFRPGTFWSSGMLKEHELLPIKEV